MRTLHMVCATTSVFCVVVGVAYSDIGLTCLSLFAVAANLAVIKGVI